MNTERKQATRSAVDATVKALGVSALLVLVTAMLSLPLMAQDHQSHHQKRSGNEVIIGKKGVIHTTSALRVGGALLKPGMYQVQHLLEGDNHVITFREIDMRYAYREPTMMALPAGAEAARVQCKIEPANKQWKSTTVILRTNTEGEKEVYEVRVRGENVKHVF